MTTGSGQIMLTIKNLNRNFFNHELVQTKFYGSYVSTGHTYNTNWTLSNVLNEKLHKFLYAFTKVVL